MDDPYVLVTDSVELVTGVNALLWSMEFNEIWERFVFEK